MLFKNFFKSRRRQEESPYEQVDMVSEDSWDERITYNRIDMTGMKKALRGRGKRPVPLLDAAVIDLVFSEAECRETLSISEAECRETLSETRESSEERLTTWNHCLADDLESFAGSLNITESFETVESLRKIGSISIEPSASYHQFVPLNIPSSLSHDFSSFKTKITVDQKGTVKESNEVFESRENSSDLALMDGVQSCQKDVREATDSIKCDCSMADCSVADSTVIVSNVKRTKESPVRIDMELEILKEIDSDEASVMIDADLAMEESKALDSDEPSVVIDPDLTMQESKVLDSDEPSVVIDADLTMQESKVIDADDSPIIIGSDFTMSESTLIDCDSDETSVYIDLDALTEAQIKDYEIVKERKTFFKVPSLLKKIKSVAFAMGTFVKSKVRVLKSKVRVVRKTRGSF